MPIDYITDVRLEIEEDTDELRNEIPNPNGDLGGWGWITPQAGSTLDGLFNTTDAVRFLSYKAPGAGAASFFYSEPFEVTPGEYVAARWTSPVYSAAAGKHYAKLVFIDAAGAIIAPPAASVGPFAPSSAAVRVMPPTLVPAGAVLAYLRFDTFTASDANPTTNQRTNLRLVTVARAATAAELATIRTNYVSNPRVNTPTVTGGWELLNAAWSGSAIVKSGAGDEMAQMTANDKLIPVEPLRPYTASGESVHDFDPVNGGGMVLLSMVFYGATGTQLTHALGAEHYLAPGGTMAVPPAMFTAPAGAATGRLVATFVPDVNVAGVSKVEWDQLMVEQTDTPGVYFDGATTDAGGWSYDYFAGSQSNASTATYSELAYIEPIPYLNVFGASTGIEITREELNLGVLTATILDPNLDPAQAEALLEAGRRCRLVVGDELEPVFTGELDNAKVEYRPEHPNPAKRVRITLTAVDPAKILGAVARPQGVGTIAELPYVLEGAGVPWSVNGSGNQVPNAVVIAVNDSAKAIDQLALTRDSVLGRAWIDRRGIVQAWDTDQLGTVPVRVLDETVYRDLAIDYDSDRCIDTVTVTVVNELGETSFGPYVAPGVRRPSHPADFRVMWAEASEAEVATFAGEILAANATPKVRINSVQLPVRELDLALLDLYDLVTVSNDRAGITENVRIAGLTHRITVDRVRGGRWSLEVDLVDDSKVAPPQATPALPPASTAQTLAELLRPVGEVTMFHGLPSSIPAGWLAIHGGTFDAGAYPKLATYLGLPATGAQPLPDMTDRIPVGAGVKAVGAASGGWTKTIAQANLPQHSHTMNHTHDVKGRPAGPGAQTDVYTQAAGAATIVSAATSGPTNTTTGGGPGTAAPLDITPPVRALYFAIRAVSGVPA